MVAATILDTTTDSATTDSATTDTGEAMEAPESAQLAAWRERVVQAEEAAQGAFVAAQEVQSAVARAQSAREERQQALREAEAAAQTAATEALTAGTAVVRRAERKADATAERLRRELTRAETSVASLQAEADQAHTRYRELAQVAAEARSQFVLVQAREREEEHAARIARLLDDLREAVAAVRAHNRDARAGYPAALCLPGAHAARNAAMSGGAEFAEALTEQGVYVFFAPDLCREDIAEDLGRLIASRRGQDIAELYRGWGR